MSEQALKGHEKPHFDDDTGSCMCECWSCSESPKVCICPECNGACGSEIHRSRGALDPASELEWWRTEFATRFMSDNLPRPGDALLGRRFRLLNDDDSTERDYSRSNDHAD